MSRQIFQAGPTWSGSSINYGNDRAFGAYFDAAAITRELTMLRRYFNNIRVFIPHYGYAVTHSLVQNCLYIIDCAVMLGFHEIVWGITCSEAILTAATYSDYVTACVARAAAAQTHGVTTFAVGNEEDYHIDGTSLTKTQIQAHARNDLYLPTKAVFGGKVSYNLPSGVLSDWLAGGKGSLDTLGMNVYGASEYDGAGFCRDVRNFYNTFGGTSYISEYGINFTWSLVTMNDEQQYTELKKRHDFIKNIGLSAGYFFLFSHLSGDQFAVCLANGQYRSMWKAIVQDRFSWTGMPNVEIYKLRQPKPT